jgi:hypothetical protein
VVPAVVEAEALLVLEPAVQLVLPEIMVRAVVEVPVEVQALQLEVLVQQEQMALLLLPILRLLFRALQMVMILQL